MVIYDKIKNDVKRVYHDTFVNQFAGSYMTPAPIRFLIYRLCKIDTKTLRIRSRCQITGNNIKIGKGTFINYGCYLETSVGITIGENCAFGMEVLLCSSTHNFGDDNQRAGETVQLPIEIGDGCWIGARATILPGVKIGKGCIIAAGAVVNKNCESNSLYAGVPARKIKAL